jgi:hypothetical protein
LNDSDIDWLVTAGHRHEIGAGATLIEEGRPLEATRHPDLRPDLRYGENCVVQKGRARAFIHTSRKHRTRLSRSQNVPAPSGAAFVLPNDSRG